MSEAVEAVETVTEDLIPLEVIVEPSPFALSPEAEVAPKQEVAPEVERVDVYRIAGNGAATLIGTGEPGQSIMDITPVPAMPGTPESDYRRCPCIGVMPGRACPRCNCSKWVKTCPKCHGEMVRTVSSRKGAHSRTERCGFCMGLGQVAARLEDVRAQEELAKAYTAPPASGRQVYPRGPQLPGVRAATFAERAAKKSVTRRRRRRK